MSGVWIVLEEKEGRFGRISWEAVAAGQKLGAQLGVPVNAILPGWIHTDLTASASAERYNFIKARIPHGRWGEPDELAGAAVFLASRASDYITGIALPVDGGYTSM